MEVLSVVPGAKISFNRNAVDSRSFLIKPINNATIGACTKPIIDCEYYNAKSGNVPCNPDISNCPD